MRKILILLMVLTIVFPAVLAFCHCCAPVPSHDAILSGPGMNCCDMIKTFFRECAPSVEKNSTVPASIPILFFLIAFFLTLERFRSFQPSFLETGPPRFPGFDRLYLSLSVLRI